LVAADKLRFRLNETVVSGTEKRRQNVTVRMNEPKRIQRSRSKGWKMAANAIYLDRPTVLGKETRPARVAAKKRCLILAGG
jgi:hypothetical protein